MHLKSKESKWVYMTSTLNYLFTALARQTREQAYVLKGKFKGDCKKFGKYGHKASDCRSKGTMKELTPEQKEK